MAESGGSSINRDLSKIQQAYEKALKTYGHRADVTGIDIGYKYKDGTRRDEIVLRVHLREKVDRDLLSEAELLPPEVDGVPLDVIQASYAPSSNGTLASNGILALAARRHRRDPVQPGLSISHHLGTAGTIGAVVYDRTDGAACILSNKHVLAEAVLAEVGDQILQPGRTDGGRRDVDAIARLRRMYLGVKGDAAIAALNQTRQVRSAQYGTDLHVQHTRRAQVGDRVVKSGRTTGVTEARVDGVGRFKVKYGFQEHRIDGFKLRAHDPANPGNLELTFHGDSGSLWYDPATQEGLGLHFAGEDDHAPAAEYALACHLDAVLDELLVSLEPVAPEDFISPNEIPVPDPADPEPTPGPSGPTLADLLSGAGASEETLRNLSHDEACAAALREHGLSVTTGADGTLEIEIDPKKTRGRLRLVIEPE